MVLRTASHASMRGHTDRLPASGLRMVASWCEDTCFPPCMNARQTELRELVDAMRSAPLQFLDIAREARSASGTPIAPSIPEASSELLESLVEALADRAPRSHLNHALRVCASDAHAWLALRLASHRLEVEHAHSQ